VNRLHLSFAQWDIYAKVGGGMRLLEPGMDVALVAAVLSSYYDLPLPDRAVFWGEVDLNGQIRPVAGHSIREAQARRLGYAPLICPAGGDAEKERAGLRTVNEMRQALFSRST
jgi:DNA repair protein RadA/Sms